MPDWPDRTGYYTWYAPAYVQYIGLYIFNIIIITTAIAISFTTKVNIIERWVLSFGSEIFCAIFGDQITSVMAGGRQKIICFGWFIIALMGEDCGWQYLLERFARCWIPQQSCCPTLDFWFYHFPTPRYAQGNVLKFSKTVIVGYCHSLKIKLESRSYFMNFWKDEIPIFFHFTLMMRYLVKCLDIIWKIPNKCRNEKKC